MIVKQAYDNYWGGNNTALELSIAGTTDKITFNGFRRADNPAGDPYNTLQRVRFDDGTEWDLATLIAKSQVFTDGDDNVRGTIADDSFSGGLGNDVISGAGGNDVIDGGPGNDTLNGDDGDDQLTGGNGNDAINGGNGNDVLAGDDGNDNLDGGYGNDTLTGGTGDDSLSGSYGDDILDGGAGNDTLQDGYGSDTILFGRGDGQDRVYFGYNTGGNVNTLQFKAGVAPADVIVRQAYDNYWGGNNTALELSIAGTTDKITFNGFRRADNPAGDPYNTLQRVRFDDGTEWDLATLIAKSQVFTDGDDNVRGTIADDSFSGGLGNDTISGAGGNDVIDGGPGNDTLNGDDGDDQLTGGNGNDAINGGNGNDVLAGDDGNDNLDGGYGNDTLTGGTGDDSLSGSYGDDILDGGAGNDTLQDGYGSDTILFGRGDGQDRVYFGYNTGGNVNTLQFKAGVAPADVIVRQAYDNYWGGNNTALELSIAGTTDKITFNGFMRSGNPAGDTYNTLQKVRFADGTEWTIADLLARLMAGTTADDNVAGTIGADEMHGGTGNDTLAGRGGDDTLYGEEGNDALYGEDGNDTLVGGAGDDRLDGGNGNNTFVFGRGDGQDTIAYGTYDYSGTRLNTLQFRADVLPGDVSVRRVYDSQSGGINGLEFAIVGTSDRITANYFFYSEDPATGYNQLQQVKFADGTTWNIAQLVTLMNAGSSANDALRGTNGVDVMTGGRGNDSLEGRGGNDQLSGGDGNDALYGEDGNDTLDGGTGNDWLDGGNGNNTFLFGRGDGQDTIAYGTYDYSGTRLNTLQFKAGVAPTDVTVRRVTGNQGSGNEAVEFAIAGTEDRITANYFFYSDNPGTGYNQLQQVRFDDGTVWNIGAILTALGQGTASEDTLRGTSGADTLNGNGGSDSLSGAAGDDRLNGGDGFDALYGEDGNDTLDGGTGNDWLDGGNGNNTFLFGRGDGQDTIA
ncbi:hypothetical protein LXT13_27455, partial [Pelomonas sp. P8]|nr:hypothetical protein [Pelomonas sp. P8]